MTLDEWQAKIDSDYPAGAVVRAVPKDSPAESGGTVFKTTGLTVVSMVGEEPKVRFWDSGLDKDFLVVLREYEQVRINPVKVVRLVTDENEIFLLGGGLTPENVQIGWMATRRVERDTALEFAK